MTTLIFRLSYAAAVVGALALCSLILMTILSIAGSALSGVGLGPVPGEYELVEVISAVAIFFFLPWTDLSNSHATVGIFHEYFSAWMQKTIEVFGDLLMIALWIIFTWKLWDGLLEKYEAFESTFILQMPLWWAYAVCFVGAVIGCLAYFTKALINLGLAKKPVGIETVAPGVH